LRALFRFRLKPDAPYYPADVGCVTERGVRL
jgi:hypothetical protein